MYSLLPDAGQFISEKRTTSSVYIRYERFLARVIKKKKAETDNPASSRHQGKYMKYVSFPCPPLEAAGHFFSLRGFFLLKISEKELIKTK